MRVLLASGLVLGLLGSGLVACAPADPPTVTPVPASAPSTGTGTGSTVVEIPLGTPPAGAGQIAPVQAEPVQIGELLPYNDPGGLFSMVIPYAWAETRQPAGTPGSDVKVGTLFQPTTGEALITVTQFDNGQRPETLGSTANGVLQMTGWRDQPGYSELARETSLARPDEAMRLEITYSRANGVPMHSLVLFQIDGTTFSMVHVGVDEGSYRANEGLIRDILDSYRAPAVAAGGLDSGS